MEQASLGKVKPSPAWRRVWEALPASIYPQETGCYCRDSWGPGAWALGWQWKELRGRPRAGAVMPPRAQPASSRAGFLWREALGPLGSLRDSERVLTH